MLTYVESWPILATCPHSDKWVPTTKEINVIMLTSTNFDQKEKTKQGHENKKHLLEFFQSSTNTNQIICLLTAYNILLYIKWTYLLKP